MSSLESLRAKLLPALVVAGLVVCAPALGADEERVEAAYHWWLAGAQVEEGDADGALESFEKAVELDSEEPFLRVEFAEFLYRQRLLGRAQKQVEKARELAPDEPVVLRAYGQIQLAQAGRSDAALNRAVSTFERLREVDPDDIEGMLILGQLYQGSGDVDKAIDVYEELVRNNNDNQQLKRLLIDTLTKAGKTERARELLEEVLRLEQESLDSRLRLAELESEKGNHSAAIDILLGRRGTRNEDPRLLEALAREYLLRSQSPGVGRDRSREDLQKALETVRQAEPTPATRGSLGFLEANILGSLGEVDEAIRVLRGLGEEGRRDLRIPLFLARLLEADGDVESAASILEGLVEVASGRPALVAEVRDRLARLEARRGRWLRVRDLTQDLLGSADEAVRLRALSLHLDALMQLEDPQSALQLLRREQRRYSEVPATLVLREARMLATAGRRREALRTLERDELVAEEAMAQPNIPLGRAQVYFQLDREDDAIAVIEKYVEEGSFERLFTAGQFFSNPEGFERAAPFFRRAVESPQAVENAELRADAHFMLGQALERTGDLDGAAREFQSVLAIRENDSTAMNYLGYMWVDSDRNVDEGYELIQRAVDMEPENGAYADSLGWALYRLGRFEEAQRELERAIDLSPDNATILEHLGDVYRARGERDLAVDAYEKAVALEDQGIDQAEGDVQGKLEALLESP
ncbi:MAG: tetratricopeptide repeat protein [Acidobacteriota bacterium]